MAAARKVLLAFFQQKACKGRAFWEACTSLMHVHLEHARPHAGISGGTRHSFRSDSSNGKELPTAALRHLSYCPTFAAQSAPITGRGIKRTAFMQHCCANPATPCAFTSCALGQFDRSKEDSACSQVYTSSRGVACLLHQPPHGTPAPHPQTSSSRCRGNSTCMSSPKT